jgi:hypothetical protein
MPDVNIDTEFKAALDGTALIGARVYPLRFPQNATFPVATYTRISSVPDQTFDRSIAQTRTRFQVDVFARSYSEARQGAAQLKAAILDFYSGGVAVYGLGLENEADGFNPDTNLYQTLLDVVIAHG